MSAVDNLTVLTSTTGKFATKQFSVKKDGKIQNRSYGNETFFSVNIVAVTDIHSLADALERIARDPHSFVIRGEPTPETDHKRTRRLSLPDRKTGEPATFQDRPRHWFSVDVDNIACAVLTDPAVDPDGAVEYVIGLLPPELHDATCWWQFSSSQSVMVTAGTADSLSLHLWYWSAVPLDSAALTRWALAANQIAGFKLIGPEFFRTVQAHYTAAPIFVEPLRDPLPRRSGLRCGLDETVRLIIPPPNPKRPFEPSATGYEPGAGVEHYLRQIGGAAGFREPIKKAIGSYIAIYGSQADIQPLYRAIRAALDRAETEWRMDPGGQRYVDDDHLDKITDWIRRQHGDQPPKGFIAEPPPYVVDPEIPVGTPQQSPGPTPEFCDDALALLFSEAHAGDLRYVALLSRWLLWSETRWQFEDTLKAYDLARTICRDASARVPANMAKLASDVASAKTVAAVERLAKADRRHATRVDQWDADVWLFNRRDCTTNLRSGDTHPHRREDYITKIAGCAGKGDCPQWLAFLDKVTAGDKELQSFLQRVAGYCLTGDTSEHAMFFLYGTGSNGKGVFINTLTGIWGDYAAVAPMEMFIETREDRHPTELAHLRGARLVVAQETERGRRWAESKVKTMTGGDPITARYMRQDFFTFIPQFKLLIAGNHKPSLRSVNEAIRRRLNLIPFTVTIPQKDRDKKFAEKLKVEWPGILRWAIEGCALWRKKGLDPPKIVSDASKAYFAEEDILGTWIEERCALDKIYAERAATLYENWKSWSEARGERPGSHKIFSQNLDERGFAHKHERTGSVFFGIALKP